ncbi:hypothetical protein A2961_04395 [Candidatus Woesebacteria bacterium RIFCSPLOWO2_01_FULL_39_21]|uniref:Carrier domain-containing protein n=1 Tax=Candidatus Woesebacteria bacterium RIFCSPLOWO2_01_FULL_39_21 TaxID=1802519 RepID=A0A1F8BLC3_9BACT|nr:MAG: hypothetical protein A2691_01865 [Candidatus Woesebacteria bacterium RIFCSPHIGHO2_01_FULL_39_23]OGM64469.1 MAG: hypothetical protein A2961_04395 [Candidatus Woesebacteria bacterium RIFCSPLOWO2_01_FULL_39_21]
MQNNQTESLVKKTLAEFLGLEPEDINLEDSLSEDLHMSASDITEFLEKLTEVGKFTENIEVSHDDSVGKIIEELSSLEEF